MSSTPQAAPIDPAPCHRTAFDALDLCHRHTALALGRLAALTTQLSRGEPDPQTAELARSILDHFNVEMREHHRDEEQHVFPALAATGDAAMADTLARLRLDHGWIEQDWVELAPHLDAIANGQSWYDLDMLREAGSVFTALCHAHVALEESLIYPQARAALSVEQLRSMRTEMARRRQARQPSPMP
jgi:hemerythrin-like domain-containing protein